MDQTWPPDSNQWLQAASSKPQDSRISKKLQAASAKLDKLQALGYYEIMKIKKPQTDKPEEGKIYALTGVRDSKCILNGYSWKESEVKEEEKNANKRS